MATEILSAQRLRELLHYDQETGLFTRRTRTSNRINAGGIAGGKCRGYIAIRVLGRPHKAHRLAWLYVYGQWPLRHIDHIDGDKTNNRIANLRDVSESVNLQNQRAAHSHNTSGFMGVTRSGGRWRAAIKADGTRHHIGQFDTPELAHAAYLEAKRRLHPGNML